MGAALGQRFYDTHNLAKMTRQFTLRGAKGDHGCLDNCVIT
jgi:hypothetical protein